MSPRPFRPTPTQYRQACLIATERELAGRADHNKPALHFSTGCAWADAWLSDLLGALAETAVAEVTGIHWRATAGATHDGDLAGRIEVRHTRTRGGHLIIRTADHNKLDHRWVLVVGEPECLWVIGWAYGTEVVADQYRHDATSWWMPQSDLRPIEALTLNSETEALL